MKTDLAYVFCKIVLGESPCVKLREDENGHCLVLTKEHYPTLLRHHRRDDITGEAFAAVSRSVRRIGRAVNDALSPAGLNLVQANGAGSHQTVNHFHVHVLPRNLGDKLPLNLGAKPGDPATIAAVAEKIQAAMLLYP